MAKTGGKPSRANSSLAYATPASRTSHRFFEPNDSTAAGPAKEQHARDGA